MVKVAINGYGRIGRSVLRALFERGDRNAIQIVAVNAMISIENLAHLTQYDSTHGTFAFKVAVDGEHLVIDGQRIRCTADRDPSKLPWQDLDVDVVLDCTGKFKTKKACQAHLDAGAKKVLISAPGGDDVDTTVVLGVNEDVLRAEHRIVSNASCTTNCLAPVVKVLNDTIGIESGLVTTIHAYTNDQTLIDAPHKDMRRARSATMSMIPTSTGAAKAIGLVVPDLAGKLNGYAIRVPTINVSLVDLSFIAKRETSEQEINQIMQQAAQGAMQSVLEYCDIPLVSCDFNHNPASSIFDATTTQVINGNLAKVFAWYDNEWGYSNRMLDIAVRMMSV